MGRVETWRPTGVCAMLAVRWAPGGHDGRAASAVLRGSGEPCSMPKLTLNPAVTTRQEGT